MRTTAELALEVAGFFHRRAGIGYPGDTGVTAELPVGVAGFLAKPYRLDDLARVVTRVLARARSG